MRSFQLLLTVVILLLAAGSAHARYCTGKDAWLPAGGGLKGEVFTTIEFEGELHAVYRNMGTPGGAFVAMAAWNGSLWKTVSQLRSQDGGNFKLIVYNDDLYLTGSFSQLNEIPGTQGIARWNGNAWESVDYGLNGPVSHAVVYRGDLHVFGEFTAAGTVRTEMGARYDGTKWKVFDGGLAGEIGDILVYNDRIIARGAIRSLEMSHLESILVWDGTTWSPMSAGIDDFALGSASIVIYRNRLYMLGHMTMAGRLERMALWDGTAWRPLPMPDSIPSYGAFLAGLDDRLFMTRPNRADAFWGGIWSWDGSNWTRHSEFDDAWAKQWFVKYRGEVYAYGSFTASCEMPVENVAKLCEGGDCIRLSGTLFRDLNGNCSREEKEPFLPGRMIEILPGPIYAITDRNGNYSVEVGGGNHTVRLMPNGYEDRSCPEGPQEIALTKSEGLVMNFGVIPASEKGDLRIGLSMEQLQPGRNARALIRLENLGSTQTWSAVTLEYDTALIYKRSGLQPSRSRKGWIEWKVNPGGGERTAIYADFTVPPSLAPGARICLKGAVETGGGDADPYDNTRSICARVGESSAKNDISVTPPGSSDDGTYRLTRSDTVLDYLVRFANTGEEPAFTVVVTDTLDTAVLDPTTLKPGMAGHPYTLTMTADGVLRFMFENVRLPPGKENDTASRGFVGYSVRLRPDRPSGSVIRNRAHIFFGYGPPMTTNTVVSIPEGTLSTPLERRDAATTSIYPNPATTRLSIEGEIVRGSVVTLSSILGVEVARWEGDGESSMTLDLSGVRPGAYLLRFETPHGVSVRSLNVVR